MSSYQKQVSLLLQVLPKLKKVPLFALHGGGYCYQSICSKLTKVFSRYRFNLHPYRQ